MTYNQELIFSSCRASVPMITQWEIPEGDQSIRLPIPEGYVVDIAVDWGDGTTSSHIDPDVTHVYATAGSYTVSIAGKCEAWSFGDIDESAHLFRTVEQLGDLQWVSLRRAFEGCSGITFVAGAGDTGGLTDTAYMFYGVSGDSAIDLDGFDTSAVTTMRGMLKVTNTQFAGDVHEDITCALSNVIVTDGDTIDAGAPEERMVSAIVDGGWSGYIGYAESGTINLWDGPYSDLQSRESESTIIITDRCILQYLNADVRTVTVPSSATVSAENSGKWTVVVDDAAFGSTIDIDPSPLRVSSVTDAREFVDSLPTEIYDATLIAYASRPIAQGAVFGFGTSKYTPGGDAEAARSIIDEIGEITDGGPTS